MKLNQRARFLILVPILTLFINSFDVCGQTSTSQPSTSSGREFMVPKKEVNGRSIGQEDVLIQEVVVTDSSRRYRRLDVGVSGTVEGWVAKEGPRVHMLVSAPDFSFPQSGNLNPRFHGILRYEASKGTGMTLIYPESGTVWNRKLFVIVHGSGGSFLEGTLKPWNQLLDPAQPLADISPYERVILDKGYALAKTRRNAGSQGDYSVTLDDGEILEGRNVTSHTGLLLGFAQLAENLLEARLGEKPVRTYWYGHSAGGNNGRLVNYVPGENIDENGEPIIDGFLNHENGLVLPVLEKNGKDTLFVTEQDRRRFVKTIGITHPLNSRESDSQDHTFPPWVSTVDLINKRMNPKILRDKGLGDKIRMYEVRGVSHYPGGYFSDREQAAVFSGGEDKDVVLLDLSGLMDGLIDLLDDWVEKDIAPPATKSDWLELGDVDGDGVNENEAIALPEVACPLGLYHPFPASLGVTRGRIWTGRSWTGFAAFDGRSLEPRDGRGVFVDMNLDRYFGYRESVEQAWHRLGLLKPGERFSRSTYQACVEAAVSRLRQETLITERFAALYIQQASGVDFPGQ